jgi:hypothetical protein
VYACLCFANAYEDSLQSCFATVAAQTVQQVHLAIPQHPGGNHTTVLLLCFAAAAADGCMRCRVHTVLYEDLVAHPEQVARELLSVCGLGWEQAVLQFQATDRPVHTASMVQVRAASVALDTLCTQTRSPVYRR